MEAYCSSCGAEVEAYELMNVSRAISIFVKIASMKVTCVSPVRKPIMKMAKRKRRTSNGSSAPEVATLNPWPLGEVSPSTMHTAVAHPGIPTLA